MGNKDKQQQNISSEISQIALKNVATFDENGASFENLNSINFIQLARKTPSFRAEM
ncbi:hypothetical protein JT052_05535 [Helicobacter pylori]|nr:hypothetical protein [Helicobacter pylori]